MTTTTPWVGDLKIQVSGDCKLKQTFKNARFMAIVKDVSGDTLGALVSSDDEILLTLNSVGGVAIVRNDYSIFLNIGFIEAKFNLHFNQPLDDKGVAAVLYRACDEEKLRGMLAFSAYRSNYLDQKVVGSVKQTRVGQEPSGKMKFTFKGETLVYTMTKDRVVGSKPPFQGLPHAVSELSKSKLTKIRITMSGDLFDTYAAWLSEGI